MKKKKSRKHKRRSVFKKIAASLVVILGICCLVAVGLIAGSLYGFVEETELIDVDNMRLNLTSFVYAVDSDTGEMVELEKLYDTENRIWVSSADIPDHMKNAFVAIEDERFYSHMGIDIKRFTGAAIGYIKNKITNSGNSGYGGSTITQQLIKNLTRDDEYSVKRKIQEIYRAFNLERQLSKDEILEYYLNTIYLSQKCNGVASAAEVYFGKDVSELSLAQCASIAGITKYPTKYDPIQNPENNKDRQLVVLRKMYELGYITKDEYEQAKAEELVFVNNRNTEEQNVQSYFTDAAIDQVLADLMKKYDYTKEYASKVLYNGGLKIYLSIDTKIQEIVDKVYNDENTFKKTSASVQPQSSMVIMDPYTGQVKALIGGRGKKEGNRTLNRATQTLRQPGSTIKPLAVYSPAIEYGLINSSTIVNDSSYSVNGWTPRNDDRRFLGRITVRAALRGSRNVPAVKICNYLTPEAAFDFVQNNYHVSTLVDSETRGGKVYTDKVLSAIGLGGLTDGVSVLEMCAAYATFPNGGKYIQPTLYTKVLDSEGKVLLEHKGQEQIAISESTAAEMISMLTDAVNSGTGGAARIPGMRVAGKTGTTSSNNDRWFVGFTPYYVGAVWFGYDQPSSLRGFPSNPAAVAWGKVMKEIHEGLPNKEFVTSTDEKYSVMVCASSGLRATPACTELKSELFDKDDVPKKVCTVHRYAFNKNELNSGSSGVVEKNENVEGFVDGAQEGGTSEGSASTGTEGSNSEAGGSHSTNGTSPEISLPPPNNNGHESILVE